MGAVHTLLWTTNAKMIGTIYLTLSISYGVSGLLLSWLLRGELGALGEQLLFGDHQLYNTLITSPPVMVSMMVCICMYLSNGVDPMGPTPLRAAIP